MGGRAGGGAGMGRGSRGNEGDASMRGYSPQLAKAIKDREEAIRNSGNEKASIFDENGNEIYQNNRGGRTGAKLGTPKQIENNIITHNHPAIDKKGRLRSDGGGSLSKGDVEAAILNNAKEIRAVTGRYTYSLKRPKGGWNGTMQIGNKTFRSTTSYMKWENIVKVRREKYIANYKGDKEVARRRSFAVLYHQIMKAYAKAEGYTYTKTKIK